jgi:mono/diheme cytochrome c family protein
MARQGTGGEWGRLTAALLTAALLTWGAAARAAEPEGPPAVTPAGEHLDTLLKPVAPSEARDPAAEAPPLSDPRVPEADLEAARRLVNPVGNDADAISKGRLLFAADCRVCHGPPDTGPDPDTGFSPPPRDFAAPAFQGARSDGELFYAIKHGVAGTTMLPWASRLSEREMWYLVTYIRSAAPADGD